ncbi:ABC transporter permease, partial [Streptomyces sp. MCAF7]
MLEAAAILIILGVGQTFVIATAGIDLSIASVMTLGAVGFGQAYSAGWGLAASCAVAVAASTLAGLLNGFVVARGKITDFIVTLGMLSAASGLALIVSNGKPVTVIEPALLKLSTNGIGILGWMFIIAAAVAIVAHVVLFHTRFGTHLLATGGSPESATAMGISTARIKIAVYAVAGLLAGLASILLVARVGAAEPAANTSFLLNSVAAVVLGGVSLFGGRATVIGPVIGALLLTALVNGLTLLGVSQFYQPLSVGIVVSFLDRKAMQSRAQEMV